MRWRVLGPVEVNVGEQPVVLGRPQQRAVLAYLLLNANLVVPAHQLVRAVWGPAPPATALTQIYGHVSRLRRAIAAPELTGGSAGYRLSVADEEFDLARFTGLTGRARVAGAGGRPDEAAGLFQEALALWRGVPLTGAAGAFVPSTVAGLVERRLVAEEELAEVELALGRHAALVTRLGDLVAAEPLRERPVALLMLALHRGGRQAEALQVFRRYRDRLGEEHGLDPGPRLVRLHRSIVQSDPDLLPPATVPARVGPVGVTVVVTGTGAVGRFYVNTGLTRVGAPGNGCG